jgi:hypothetical protein
MWKPLDTQVDRNVAARGGVKVISVNGSPSWDSQTPQAPIEIPASVD